MPRARARASAWALVLAAVITAGALGVLAAKLRGEDDDKRRVVPADRTGRATTARRPPPRAERRVGAQQWIDRAELARRVAAVAETTGAAVGIAISSGANGRTVTLGPLQTGPAWSTIKVPLVLARYALAEQRGEPQGEIDRLAAAALTASSNEAAAALFDDLVEARGSIEAASRSVQAVLAEAGDSKTTVNPAVLRPEFSTYGQTRWSLADGAVFFRALASGCVGPARGAERVSQLLGAVVPEQRWGLGRADFDPRAETLLKGGWGPDETGRYLVRQFGIVRGPGRGILVVGAMAQAPSGSFEAGVAAVDRLAEAVAATVRLDRTPAVRSCTESAAQPGHEPAKRLVEFARQPSDETWSQLPLAETVRLGLGEQLMERHAARELRDPRAWLIEARLFRAGVGPFSPLEPLSDTRELEYGEGRYMRCASPLLGAPPREVASLRRLNIQPREWESCLQWFAVDVFVTRDGKIEAVTLDYFEP